MYSLYVIGISDELLTGASRSILETCGHVFATGRLQGLVVDLPATVHDISPLKEALASIETNLLTGNVAVLASGDPLFFGIGRRIIAEFGADRVQFFPALSSIQRAAALCKTPWDDATLLSLHGRNAVHPPGLILKNRKTILLTDKSNSPRRIAQSILNYLELIDAKELAAAIRIKVAENIGLEEQNLFEGSLKKACATTFSPLNVMLIETSQREAERFPQAFGLTEDEVIHSRGLITKNEVRAATVHQLRLPGSGILWDVGAGSGSVSIEAARTHPELTIYAIEHKEEEISNIKANIRKFGCYNIIPVFGRAPAALTTLPAPDRIFVGGSSGTLPAITELAKQKLPENGRIVINGVIEKTIKEAPEELRKNDFEVQSSTVQVSRTDRSNNPVTFNPITITAGIK